MMLSTTKNKTNKIKRILYSLGVAAFWLAVWWALAAIIGKEIILPEPPKVLEALMGLCREKEFWSAVGASFGRIVGGYAAGVAAGILLGIFAGALPLAAALLSPAVNVLKAAPVASFTILAMMWFKSGSLPLVLSAVMVMPMLYSATYHAVTTIDIKLLEMGKVFKLSENRIFFSIKLPSIMPHIIAAAASALGFAWKAGIAAEIICRPKEAMGSLLYDAKQYLEMPQVFAVTAVTVVLSILLEVLFKKVAKAVDFSKGGEMNADKH